MEFQRQEYWSWSTQFFIIVRDWACHTLSWKIHRRQMGHAGKESQLSSRNKKVRSKQKNRESNEILLTRRHHLQEVIEQEGRRDPLQTQTLEYWQTGHRPRNSVQWNHHEDIGTVSTSYSQQLEQVFWKVNRPHPTRNAIIGRNKLFWDWKLTRRQAARLQHRG